MKEKNVKKKKKLYEGKAKIVHETDNDDLLVQEFKDDATAQDGAKKGKIKGKGEINSQVSALLFTYLDSYHIPTHFVCPHTNNSMVIKRLRMIPIEVVMRNIATGSLVKREKIEEGTVLDKPLLEFYLKDDAQHDPMIERKNVISEGHASEEEVALVERYTQKVNAVLKDFFLRRGLKLVDFKLEFGRNKNGKILLGDEISPDTCRFWDAETNERLDKDRFRLDMGKVEEAYEEIRRRVFKQN